MDIIKPSLLNMGVVSGPDKKLYSNSIRSEDARKRMQGLERETKNNINKYKSRNKDKTPLVVKAAGVGILVAIAAGLLRLRFKK